MVLMLRKDVKFEIWMLENDIRNLEKVLEDKKWRLSELRKEDGGDYIEV